MRKDPTEFRKRFAKWKDGKKPYKAGIPYDDDNHNSVYDHARAAELGYQPDETGHYPTRDYETGRYLKSPAHPTVMKSVVSDLGEGYIPYYNNGQLYSETWMKPLKDEVDVPYKPKFKDGKLPGYEDGFNNETKKRIKTLYKRLRLKGFDDISAAGIIGNAIQESSLNPDSVNHLGYSGLFLNSKQIRNAIEELYGDYSYDSQLRYLDDWVSANTWIRKGKYRDYTASRSGSFKKTGYKSVQDASDAFMKYYERPVILDKAGNIIGYQDHDKRRSYSQQVYDYLVGKPIVQPVTQNTAVLFLDANKPEQFKPVLIKAPVDRTDFSLLNASMQSLVPESLNAWNGALSPSYSFSLRMPTLLEYILTGSILPKGFKDGKLPEYYLGRNGVQEEKTDATTVNRPIIILPIKRDFIAEAQRKHAAEAIGPDNRSSYQRKLVQRAKLYANQQYQKAKDDAKRAEGLELMMKTISPSTYVEAATGLDLGTVGRLITDAAAFGLPSALKYGISKALATPILGKWVYKIPENANMAYRIMGPLERDWILSGNELSTRATNILTEAEEEAARAAAPKAGRFSLFKAGAEHGGRKQFAKGQPWGGTTTTHGEKQVLAIPGEGLPWRSGRHYKGPQGHGFGVGDVPFEEAPFGTHIDLMTNEAGFSGVNPSQLPGSVIYSPSKLFGKNLGYKILNLDRSKLASRVPGLKIHSLEHPLDSWIHTPEKQSYIRFPYSASWDDFLTDPKLGKYFTEGGEAEVYESFNNPGYLTKVKLKIPEEGTTLEDLEYAVNRDLKINELPGTEPIVYKGFSTPEIIRKSLNQDTRFVSDEFVPIWELRKLTPTDKVNFKAFNVDPEQIVNDFASDFGYRYNPDGSWQFGKIKLSDLGIKNFAYDSFGNLKFIDPMIQGFKDGKSPIHIKPSHRGKLTALKKRTGKSEEELYNDGNPAHKKMVVFARNARKWKH